MSTYTDTTVRISLATPDDIRDLSQRSLHFWVGAASPLWAPFWLAASFGVGLWSLGQVAARTLGGTLYDKDLPLAAKWPGFEALPKPVAPLNEGVVENTADAVTEAVATTLDTVEETQSLVSEAVETAIETAEAVAIDAVEKTQTIVEDAGETVVDTTEAVTIEAAETTQAVAAETVEAATDTAKAATAKAVEIAAVLPKKADETLDLLGNPRVAPVRDTRTLIDPVTELPVVPAAVEAVAEPKIPMPKPAPRRPRKG